MREMKTIRIGEPFLLLIDIKNQSTHPIKFETSGLNKVCCSIIGIKTEN
jgi:hypothetical protein